MPQNGFNIATIVGETGKVKQGCFLLFVVFIFIAIPVLGKKLM